MKREKHIWAFTKRHIVWYSDKATGKGQRLPAAAQASGGMGAWANTQIYSLIIIRYKEIVNRKKQQNFIKSFFCKENNRMDEEKRLREVLETAAKEMTEKELRIVLAFIRGLLSNKK